MSEALHVPYQRDNRARWIITADLYALTLDLERRYVASFGSTRGAA